MLIAAAATIFLVGSARAEELTATIKSVDADNHKITVTINGDEKTMKVSDDAEIYTQTKGKKNKPGPKQPIAGGLSGLKVGTEVSLVTFKSGDDDIVSSIGVDPTKRPKK
jgi:Cu/Ag efflux protein CusF